jgi:hypothetical protein
VHSRMHSTHGDADDAPPHIWESAARPLSLELQGKGCYE